MVLDRLRFSKEHEWVSVEGDVATVGISEYAQQQLGDVTFVELPEVGKEVEQAGVLGCVESVKAASDYFAPVSGSVVEVNTALDEHPELVNQDPYQRGWICRLKVKEPAELEALMGAEQYQGYVEGLTR